MAIDEVQAIWFVVGLVIFFLLLPPNWDPAIKLKELMENKGDKPTDQYCPANTNHKCNMRGCTTDCCLGSCMPLKREKQ